MTPQAQKDKQQAHYDRQVRRPALHGRPEAPAFAQLARERKAQIKISFA